MVHYSPREFTPLKAGLYRAAQGLCLRPFFALSNRLEIEGAEKIPKSGPLIVTANHLSMVDPPLLAAVLNRPVAFVAKEELFSSPMAIKCLKFMCAFSINRQHPEPSTFKAARYVLRQGWALVMFIEGTRNRTPGRLLKPAIGPTYVARMNNVPILPVGITGTTQRFGKAFARVGDLIHPTQDLEATTWEVMEALSGLTGFQLPAVRELADPSQWALQRTAFT